MAWFSIQCYGLVKMYLQYDTTVTVDFHQVSFTDVPAVTICAYSLIDDQDLEKNGFGKSFEDDLDMYGNLDDPE